MSIATNRLLRHMSWANQKVFSAIQTLPDSALTVYLVNPEWSAGEILRHIASGADWFAYRLTGSDWHEITKPKAMSDVVGLAHLLLSLDEIAIQSGELADELITQEIEGKSVTYLRSTMVSQAIHHATEHRAQLIDALEYHGFKPINLDDIDLWHFENFENKK